MSLHSAMEELRPTFAGRAVCITGGAGFIGGHLSESLVELGARVCVIDDLSNGFEANLAAVASRVRFVRGSILDTAALGEAVKGAEFIFHLAALGSVPRSVEVPVEYHEVNATGTLRVLQAARAAGARRVVYSGSSSAYGDTPTLPKVETMCADPRSPYAVGKLAGEAYCRAFACCYGMETVTLRYFNVFGPRQRPDSQYAAVIPRWADALRRGEQPVVYGDGKQTRDFTHVDNAVYANLLAAACPGKLSGEVVNIGCGARDSLLGLLALMSEALAKPNQPKFAPERAGDVRASQASIEAARALIGYRVIVPFADGLRRTLAP